MAGTCKYCGCHISTYNDEDMCGSRNCILKYSEQQLKEWKETNNKERIRYWKNEVKQLKKQHD